jgi:hypothetical protein
MYIAGSLNILPSIYYSPMFVSWGCIGSSTFIYKKPRKRQELCSNFLFTDTSAKNEDVTTKDI